MLKIYETEYRENESGKMNAQDAAAQKLLAAGLRDLYGLDIADCRFKREPGGKPYLTCPSGLYFNISHSHGRAICAFSDRCVGADIEQYRQPSGRLLQRVLAGPEQRRFDQLTAAGIPASLLFAVFWTLKESYMKYTGQGLSFPPDKAVFEISLRDGRLIGRMTAPEENLRFYCWHSDNFALAICSSGTDAPSIIRL